MGAFDRSDVRATRLLQCFALHRACLPKGQPKDHRAPCRPALGIPSSRQQKTSSESLRNAGNGAGGGPKTPNPPKSKPRGPHRRPPPKPNPPPPHPPPSPIFLTH